MIRTAVYEAMIDLLKASAEAESRLTEVDADWKDSQLCVELTAAIKRAGEIVVGWANDPTCDMESN